LQNKAENHYYYSMSFNKTILTQPKLSIRILGKYKEAFVINFLLHFVFVLFYKNVTINNKKKIGLSQK
jgi:hypothetical protein